LPDYAEDRIVEQVKVPVTVAFKSLAARAHNSQDLGQPARGEQLPTRGLPDCQALLRQKSRVQSTTS
jgi:hypothetical protein